MHVLFSCDNNGYLPPWFCYTTAACFFLYMLCDNTDGKQARNTGSSSPLGMLMDHGIDSIIAIIGSLMLQRVLQIGRLC